MQTETNETKMSEMINSNTKQLEISSNDDIYNLKSVDNDGNKLVVYENPDIPVTPLVVRIGLTIYDMGFFDVAAGTVPVVFDLWLVYDSEIYDKTFNSLRDALPWTMPNALELDVAAYATYKMYGTDLDTLNIFAKRQKFNKGDTLKLFTIEMYTCRGLLKLTTFPSQDPFQSIYVVVKIAMDGTPGSEMTKFKPSKTDCYFPGARAKIADFTKGKVAIREFTVPSTYGEYSRLYFIFEYEKSPLEDIAKYYLLPMLINALTIAFHESVDSLFDSAGAYFLAIIALLFTLPETGAFTRNEKAVVMGSAFMLVILLILISVPTVQSQIILGSVLGGTYFCLLIYDIVASKKVNNKYRTVLFDGDLSKLDAI